MNWKRKGLIYVPGNEFYWNKSHAQVPVVDIISQSVWRIYYSTRDASNRSNVSFIEVKAGSPEQILYEHNEPILQLGDAGTFDESGIMPSCIIDLEDRKYLYYIGWNRGGEVSYRLSIGLAVSDDGGKTFIKVGKGPIMDRSIHDSCLVASPFVIVEDGVFKMWYISGTHWSTIDGRAEPFYHIKYATSTNGVDWNRTGQVCVDYDDFTDGISRPCLIRSRNGYLLFYSFRNNLHYREDPTMSYRLGFARSIDGLTWKRDDKSIGILHAASGWDSEMMAYPYLVVHEETAYLFYNGNGFGKTGFGYAITESNELI